MYQALEIQNIDEILPPPQQPQPTDPAIENAKALSGQLLQVFPEQSHNAHILVHTTFMQTPLVSHIANGDGHVLRSPTRTHSVQSKSTSRTRDQ